MSASPHAPSLFPAPESSDWTAPTEDGHYLIWPRPDLLLAQMRSNHQALSAAHDVRLQKIPLPELRERMRRYIGHADDGKFLIATGHQVELFHPGVWVKDVLANALATQSGGAALHVAVDTDAPKHLHLRWPGYSRPITDDPNLNSLPWSALLSSPTSNYLGELVEDLKIASASWTFRPAMEPFFEHLRRQAAQSPHLSPALIQAIQALQAELGLRHRTLLLSPMLASEAYLVFAHHLLARAGDFAADYNGALAQVRAALGIRSHGRPMPDLHVQADEIEVPFWLDDVAAGQRRRATVLAHQGRWMLRSHRGETFEFDPDADGWDAARRLAAFLRDNRIQLAPRALTLTIFLRLLLADYFVHGIGGGRYDQVSDHLIRRHFEIAPPAYAVTTATLYFPSAAGQRRIDLRPLWQESRRIRHGLLSAAKRGMVRQIAELPRLSPQRSQLYHAMHAKLAEQSNSPAVRQAELRLVQAQQQRAAQRPLFDRELFFALQPLHRLQSLIEKFDAHLSKAAP